MNNKLIIISKLEALDKYLEKIYYNFPKKERILKEELISIIKEIYLKIYHLVYNYNNNNALEIISNLKYLNNLIDTMYQKKIINQSKYLYIGNLLIEITKLLKGYINEKNK